MVKLAHEHEWCGADLHTFCIKILCGSI